MSRRPAVCYEGKEGNPVLQMEVIADLDLWIWPFHFGLPGGFYDLNVLEVSHHFEKVLSRGVSKRKTFLHG